MYNKKSIPSESGNMTCDNINSKIVNPENNNKQVYHFQKEVIKQFRNEIAELEKLQREYKNNRKTVNLKGVRKYPVWEAQNLVRGTSEELRVMYAAYGLLRGRKFSEIESNAKPLIYDKSKFFAYPYGLKGQHYCTKEELDGKHPLCEYLGMINNYLRNYGFEIPCKEEKHSNNWREWTETVYDYGNCEEVICVGEQEA